MIWLISIRENICGQLCQHINIISKFQNPLSSSWVLWTRERSPCLVNSYQLYATYMADIPQVLVYNFLPGLFHLFPGVGLSLPRSFVRHGSQAPHGRPLPWPHHLRWLHHCLHPQPQLGRQTPLALPSETSHYNNIHACPRCMCCAAATRCSASPCTATSGT